MGIKECRKVIGRFNSRQVSIECIAQMGYCQILFDLDNGKLVEKVSRVSNNVVIKFDGLIPKMKIRNDTNNLNPTGEAEIHVFSDVLSDFVSNGLDINRKYLVFSDDSDVFHLLLRSHLPNIDWCTKRSEVVNSTEVFKYVQSEDLISYIAETTNSSGEELHQSIDDLVFLIGLYGNDYVQPIIHDLPFEELVVKYSLFFNSQKARLIMNGFPNIPNFLDFLSVSGLQPEYKIQERPYNFNRLIWSYLYFQPRPHHSTVLMYLLIDNNDDEPNNPPGVISHLERMEYRYIVRPETLEETIREFKRKNPKFQKRRKLTLDPKLNSFYQDLSLLFQEFG